MCGGTDNDREYPTLEFLASHQFLLEMPLPLLIVHYSVLHPKFAVGGDKLFREKQKFFCFLGQRVGYFFVPGRENKLCKII
jgi:hypothetical protein